MFGVGEPWWEVYRQKWLRHWAHYFHKFQRCRIGSCANHTVSADASSHPGLHPHTVYAKLMGGECLPGMTKNETVAKWTAVHPKRNFSTIHEHITYNNSLFFNGLWTNENEYLLQPHTEDPQTKPHPWALCSVLSQSHCFRAHILNGNFSWKSLFLIYAQQVKEVSYLNQ